MRVLFVAAECDPFLRTGGLGDVVGALPRALAARGVDVRVLLPRYGVLAIDDRAFMTPMAIADLFGGEARLLTGRAAGLSMILIDAPHLFGRDGNPYVRADGSDWPDNAARFGALSRAAAVIARDGLKGWRPDIVHAHDWHAALTPLHLQAAGAATPSVLTLHNIAYQGLFPAETRHALHLPADRFTDAGYAHHGQVSFLKAGITAADRLTTVSPTYAAELTTPAFGMGLDAAITGRDAPIVGLLNGIDTASWDPRRDLALAARYGPKKVKRRAKNKAALEAAFGFSPAPDRFLLCMIGRLTAQKGVDLLLDALPRITAAGARLAVLGTGDAEVEGALVDAAEAAPEALRVRLAFDGALARLIHAGADAILVPSRFEPCGLTQLCGLRYGTVPIVSRTGGLADTVIDANPAGLAADCATGFQFQPATADALAAAVDRAAAHYADPAAWRRLVARGMRHPVGWDHSARGYAALYRDMASA